MRKTEIQGLSIMLVLLRMDYGLNAECTIIRSKRDLQNFLLNNLRG